MLKNDESGSMQRAASSRGADAEAGVSFERLSVLVVEDDPADFALVDRALRRMTRFEAHVTLCGSVESARQALKLTTFDLVLADQSLDDASGLSLMPSGGAGALGCPAILVTGLLTSDLNHAAIDRGFAACIEKDELTPRVLEALIRQTLTGFKLQRQLARAGGDGQSNAVTLPEHISPHSLLLDAVSELLPQCEVDVPKRLVLTLDFEPGSATHLRVDTLALLRDVQSAMAAWLFGPQDHRTLELKVVPASDEMRIVAKLGAEKTAAPSPRPAHMEEVTLARIPVTRRSKVLS